MYYIRKIICMVYAGRQHCPSTAPAAMLLIMLEIITLEQLQGNKTSVQRFTFYVLRLKVSNPSANCYQSLSQINRVVAIA